MIWCVEDDPCIRDIEVYALTSTGLEAQGFADGSAFWDALQKKQPDLVLLDVMLPGAGGFPDGSVWRADGSGQPLRRPGRVSASENPALPAG